MMHGRGIFTWPDGRKYEGEYYNDKKHGVGTYTWADGKRYEGEWQNGRQNGSGIMYTPENGGKGRTGQWFQGKRVKWSDTVN
jgi:hypothetical protein